MSKKFQVEFREWYYDEKKEQWARLLGSFIFSQENGQKKQ